MQPSPGASQVQTHYMAAEAAKEPGTGESPTQAREWKLQWEGCSAALPSPWAQPGRQLQCRLQDDKSISILTDETYYVLSWAHYTSCLLSSLTPLEVRMVNSTVFTYSSIHSFRTHLLSAYLVAALCKTWR